MQSFFYQDKKIDLVRSFLYQECREKTPSRENLKQLFDQAKDNNLIDNKGNSPLHTYLLHHTEDPNLEMVRFFLEKMPFIDKVNKAYKTCLHIACEHQNNLVISLLIEHGACINLRDKKENTPLLSYFSPKKKSKHRVDIIQLFLEKKADINARNENQETALLLACGPANGEILSFLLENTANPNIPTWNGKTPFFNYLNNSFHHNTALVELFLEKNQSVTIKDENGNDFITRCIQKGMLTATVLLYVLEQNPTCINHNMLCLYLSSNTTIDIPIIRLFLDNGANPNALSYNKAAIHYAVSCQEIDFIQLFLKAGADLNLPDGQGFTPLCYACFSNKPRLTFIEFLLQQGALLHTEYATGKNIIHGLYEIWHQDKYQARTLVIFFILKGVSYNGIDFTKKVAGTDFWKVCRALTKLLEEKVMPRELIDYYTLHYVPTVDFTLQQDFYASSFMKSKAAITAATYGFYRIEKTLLKQARRIPKWIKFTIFNHLEKQNEEGFAHFLSYASEPSVKHFILSVNPKSQAYLELTEKEPLQGAPKFSVKPWKMLF